ncbi:winged helix-turn-helix domain-containing protein [Mesorhizobium sp. YC-39]|uniref:ArsR/SmtB family transcription factor n=1 Tax=unclassified Mesorhizobium TaxID=325217 RepID=UPI0021E7F457|nr:MULTISPECIES: winged helix-turn-helix domain-containing protein [unclassified Mesorhizobium]MCV3211544.1 winged helix-turn-helix domain-containing protein [Mesorhizobium sp. YC-2]MCV3233258.1 winged helix-turn-helix domain-containing protein [Mesorhizobium sp. YC-39]
MMTLVSRLRTAAHLDRLRILGLCAHADLTVCELAEILGVRRERIVRHVRLLARADFLYCNEQPPWRSYHLKAGGNDGGLVQLLVDLLPHGDGYHKRDLQRLEAIRDARPKGPPA